MIIRYEVKDIGSNVFQAYPLSIEACCGQSLLWFMRGGEKSINVPNAFIIETMSEKRNEHYYFCQFCGKKHETVEKKGNEEKQ